MRIKPLKKLKKTILEVNPRTAPRVAAALFRTARKLPAVRLKKLLATTDFSASSLEGVRYAVSLAERLGAAVALVHVFEPAPPFPGMEAAVLAREEAEVVELAERQASRLAKKHSRKDLVVTSFVRQGKPFHEIAALARNRAVDLTVIATRGHTGLKRIWLGSTAERVVRHAPCPVLTVPSRATNEPDKESPAFRLKRIIVPIDISETSAQALPYAAVMAERFGAEVILLHVIEPLAIPAELGYLSAEIGIVHESPKQIAKEHLTRLRAEVFDESDSVRAIVRTGVPFQEISAAAKSLGADLIVLTTRGYTGLKNVFLGSTAERVVRHADCPVLVVREAVRAGKRRTLFKRASRRKRA